MLVILLSLGCAPEPNAKSQSVESQSQVDLRKTSFYLEGYNNEGVHEVHEGTYFYEDGDHLFPRSYEGTRNSSIDEVQESHSWTLDVDGFPTRRVAQWNGEFWYAREYVYDKALFLPLEITYYCELDNQPCDPTLPQKTVLYEYDDAGHLLAEQMFEYFDGSKDVQRYTRLRYLLPEATLPGTNLTNFGEEYVQYSAGGEPVYAFKTIFSDDGLPVEVYQDEDGTGEFVLWFEYDVSTDEQGRPNGFNSTRGPLIFDCQFEYGETGLLSAYTRTQASDEEPDTVVSTRIDITWHENPADALRPGKHTLYSTIDGVPDKPWTEYEWSVESFEAYRYNELDAGWTVMREDGLELVVLPVIEGAK